MLAHIHHVKDSVDRRKSTLKKSQPNAARRLYYRFLFFKNFVVLDVPVVVPEGKTDSIYLRTAIRQLPAYHPRLGQIVNGRFESAIRFMHYSRTVHDVLQLGHGTGDLKFFISKYHKIVQGFGHAPLAHPVIVLFDNDDGGAELLGFAEANGAPNIAFSSTDPFYYLGLNLYLVKTPEKAATPYKSCIEDLFDPALLKTVLDGKTFNPNKTHNAPGEYGKVAFAERVVVPNAATINFSGFAALLDRIVAVLDHHTRLKAVPLGEAV